MFTKKTLTENVTRMILQLGVLFSLNQCGQENFLFIFFILNKYLNRLLRKSSLSNTSLFNIRHSFEKP